MSAPGAPERRTLFVTTALPYANGPFHIGHIMEYIQADIWVRFQRMQGHAVHFVCADDTHGAPIMLKAEAEGITPEALIGGVAESHRADWARYLISFDTTHTTHSAENVELAQDIYRTLRDRDLISTRTIEQFYDPVKGMFLPDRYIKGECPKCGAKDQFGDACEVCGATYAPTDLKHPYSTITGATPEMRASEHLFFRLSAPEVVAFLQQWTTGDAAAAGGVQQDPGVAGRGRRRAGRLGHLARRALLRHRDSRPAGRRAEEVLLRLARRADRLPRGAEEAFLVGRRGQAGRAARLRRLSRRSRRRAVPLHRQGHRLLPHAVLAGDAALLGPQDARQRLRARLHHVLRREDVEVARDRDLAAALPGPRPQPGVAALLHRREAQRPRRGPRLQSRRLHRPRQQRPRRQVRQHREPRGDVHRPPLRRPAGDAGGGRQRPRQPAHHRADGGGGRARKLRGARVRPRAPRGDAHRRPHQRGFRRRAALAAREGRRRARPAADRLLDRARRVPAAHRDAGAGAAGGRLAGGPRAVRSRSRLRLGRRVERRRRASGRTAT